MEKTYLERTLSKYRMTPLFVTRILSLVLAISLISTGVISYLSYNKGLNKGQVIYIESLTKEQSNRDDFIASQESQVIEMLVKSGYLRDDLPIDYSVQDCVHQAAEAYPVSDVDTYALLLAVAKAETHFQNLSTTNASGQYCGYCAISPKAAISYMNRTGCWDLMYAGDNFKVASCILQSHVNRYGLEGGLSMYNGAGSGASNYSRTVLSYYNGFVDLFERVPTTYVGQEITNETEIEEE